MSNSAIFVELQTFCVYQACSLPALGPEHRWKNSYFLQYKKHVSASLKRDYFGCKNVSLYGSLCENYLAAAHHVWFKKKSQYILSMHKMLGSRFHSGTYGTNGWLCAPFNYSQQSMAVLYYDPLVKEVLGTC